MKNFIKIITNTFAAVLFGVLSFGGIAQADYSATTTLLKSGTFTVPAGVSTLTVTALGAGAGGGGGAFTYGGGGGGAGAFVSGTIVSVTPGQLISYTVGKGGIGGVAGSFTSVAGNGTNGGATTFGTSVTALGGQGGQGAAYMIGNGIGGLAGGIGGTAGTDGASFYGPSRTYGGNGGNTTIGVAGVGSIGNSTSYTAPTAGVRGAGGGAGSGWLSANGIVGDAGAAGGNGMIIVSYRADLTAPVITVLPYATSSTNLDVLVTAVTNEGTIIATSTNASVINAGATTVATFSDNGLVTFTATDAAGNVSSTTITITNIDKVAPVITVLPYATSSTNSNVAVIAETNEGLITATSSTPSSIGSISNAGATSTVVFSNNGTVTFTATDAAGNFSSRTITISNIDLVAPIITVLPYVSTPTNSNVVVIANTNEGVIAGTSTVAGIVSVGATSTATVISNGTVTFTATDAAGNFSSRTITISNIDTGAPVITILGSNPTNVEINTVYTDAGATALDTIDGDVTASIVATGTVNTAATGTYSVIYSVTDLAGNTATSSRTVNVFDTTAPVITVPATQVFEATGATTTPVLVEATAIDNSGATSTITYAPTSFGLGTSTVIWTATDISGNTSTASSLVVIQDTTAPVITLNGSTTINILVGDTYTELSGTATDIVDGSVAVSATGTVDTLTVGTYTIVYSASDLSANTATTSRTVIVSTIIIPDVTAPVITLNGSSTINLLVGDTYVELNATAIDAVDGPVAVSATGTVNTAIAGTYTITYTAIDTAMNVATTSRTINVSAVPIIPQAAVNLLSAGNFVILSQSGITNIPTSVITGNIGTSPITGASITGLSCSEITGTVYTVDAAGPACRVVDPSTLTSAVSDMQTAYADAAGRTGPTATELGAGDISGMTLASGLYKWSTDVNINTDLTLSGSSTEVWIFQISGNLNIASGASVPAGIKVNLIGGAQASNIFWQVGGPTGTTLGTYSTFNGNILSATQIILQTGAVLNGRALAQTQVTLDANTISSPSATSSVLTSISILPLNPTLSVGSTTAFTATTLDQFGNPIVATTTWTSSDLLVGTIDAAGIFTATSSGTTTITATAGAISTSTVVTVSNVVIPPTNTVTINNSTVNGIFYASHATTSGAIATITGTTTITDSTVSSSTLNDSIISTSTIVSSNLNRCTVLYSTVGFFTGTDCFIDPSYVWNSIGDLANAIDSTIIDSDFSTSTISTSTVLNSTVNYSTTTFSYIATSTVLNSVMNYSTSTFSTITTSTIDNSTITNSNVSLSNLDNANISNSTTTNSTVTTSTIDNGSVINGSNVSLSDISNSDITNSTLVNATSTDSTVNDSVINNSELTNSVVASSTVTDSNIVNSTSTDSTITDSSVTNSTIDNSTVASSTITDSTLTNSSTTDSTIASSTLTNVVAASSSITNTVLANATTTNAVIDNGTIYSGTIEIGGVVYVITVPTLISSLIGTDTVAPVITLNGVNPENVIIGGTYTDAGATAYDAFDATSTLVSATGTVDTLTVGVYTIVYSTSDIAGNIATSSRIVNVNPIAIPDTTAPVITILGSNPVTVLGDDTYIDAGATALDNIDGNITGYIITTNSVNTSVIGAYTVVYSVVDAAGNSATATRIVNVVSTPDVTVPVITILGVNPENVVIGTLYTDAGATASDNVDGDITTNIITAGLPVDTSVAGTQYVTYSVTDGAGNSTSSIRTINIIAVPLDTIPPVITINGGNMTITVGSSYADLGATAYDAVSGTTTVTTINNVNTSATGTYSVDYSATDVAGNTATTSRTVNVIDAAADTIAPVIDITGGTPITIEVGSPYTDAGATALDNIDGVVAVTTTSNNVDTAVAGTYAVVYSAIDSAFNNSTATRVVDVVVGSTTADVIPPAIMITGGTPITLTVGDVYTDAGATALDIVDGAITATTTSNNVDTAVAGTYAVVYSASDLSGNTSTATRTVIVNPAPADNIPPVITINGGASIQIALNSTYTDLGATAYDAFDNATTTLTGVSNVNVNATGTYSVDYSATDVAGNTATTSRIVTVIADTLAPTITILGTNPMNVIRTIAYVEAGAASIDNVDGNISAGIVITGSVNVNATGTYSIVYTSTDSSGNISSSTRTVNVIEDNIAPVITITGINPVTLTVGDVYTDAGATAFDNIDGVVIATTTSNNVNTAVAGTYAVVYSASDIEGNSTSSTRVVNVNPADTIAPVITINGLNPVTVLVGATYTDAGATALDNNDGVRLVTSTSTVDTAIAGAYTVTYTSSDTLGNTSTAIRTVDVVATADVTAPVITILGTNPVSVTVGGTYTDAGATAIDDVSGDITANITVINTVNVSVIGAYSVIYTVVDGASNSASSTRTVIVSAAPIVPSQPPQSNGMIVGEPTAPTTTTPVATTTIPVETPATTTTPVATSTVVIPEVTNPTETTGTVGGSEVTPDIGITIPSDVGDLDPIKGEVVSTTTSTSTATTTASTGLGLFAAVAAGFSNIPNKPIISLILLALVAMIGLIIYRNRNDKNTPKTPSTPDNLPTGNTPDMF